MNIVILFLGAFCLASHSLASSSVNHNLVMLSEFSVSYKETGNKYTVIASSSDLVLDAFKFEEPEFLLRVTSAAIKSGKFGSGTYESIMRELVHSRLLTRLPTLFGKYPEEVKAVVAFMHKHDKVVRRSDNNKLEAKVDAKEYWQALYADLTDNVVHMASLEAFLKLRDLSEGFQGSFRFYVATLPEGSLMQALFQHFVKHILTSEEKCEEYVKVWLDYISAGTDPSDEFFTFCTAIKNLVLLGDNMNCAEKIRSLLAPVYLQYKKGHPSICTFMYEMLKDIDQLAVLEECVGKEELLIDGGGNAVAAPSNSAQQEYLGIYMPTDVLLVIFKECCKIASFKKKNILLTSSLVYQHTDYLLINGDTQEWMKRLLIAMMSWSDFDAEFGDLKFVPYVRMIEKWVLSPLFEPSGFIIGKTCRGLVRKVKNIDPICLAKLTVAANPKTAGTVVVCVPEGYSSNSVFSFFRAFADISSSLPSINVTWNVKTYFPAPNFGQVIWGATNGAPEEKAHLLLHFNLFNVIVLYKIAIDHWHQEVRLPEDQLRRLFNVAVTLDEAFFEQFVLELFSMLGGDHPVQRRIVEKILTSFSTGVACVVKDPRHLAAAFKQYLEERNSDSELVDIFSGMDDSELKGFKRLFFSQF